MDDQPMMMDKEKTKEFRELVNIFFEKVKSVDFKDNNTEGELEDMMASFLEEKEITVDNEFYEGFHLVFRGLHELAKSDKFSNHFKAMSAL